MTTREWFGVGVRLLGAWQVTVALQYVIAFVDVRLGFSPLRDMAGRFDGRGTPNVYLLYGWMALSEMPCTTGFASGTQAAKPALGLTLPNCHVFLTIHPSRGGEWRRPNGK